MAIKMFNGKIGYSQMVHVILESEGHRETLCGIKSRDIIETRDTVTCKKCMTDAQRINKKGK